jgi:hypothetical protein
MHAETRNAYKILVGNLEGKRPTERPLGRSRSKSEDNNKIDLKEIGCESLELIHVPQCRDQWVDLVRSVIRVS